MDDSKGSPGWAPWVAAAVIGAIAVAAVLSFLSSPKKADSPSSASTQEAERGSACDALLLASEALQEGNDQAVIESIQAARSEALRSLDEGGVLFGEPEELALKLKSLSLKKPLSQTTQDEIEKRLSRAEEACEGLIS